MSLELVNTLATFGTFVVIAATAIAAIVQLRHARSSNQIEALSELREGLENREMQAAIQFVQHHLEKKLEDPDFRYQLANRSAMTPETQALWQELLHVGNFLEAMGALVKNGLADRNLVLDIFSTQIFGNWKRFVPVVAIVRHTTGDNGIWENFEYLAVLSQDWETAHPDGTYPAGVRRFDLNYPWREADKQYAASLAPA
jgi:Domain of unknown function (DUF4760)